MPILPFAGMIDRVLPAVGPRLRSHAYFTALPTPHRPRQYLPRANGFSPRHCFNPLAYAAERYAHDIYTTIIRFARAAMLGITLMPQRYATNAMHDLDYFHAESIDTCTLPIQASTRGVAQLITCT